MHRGTSSFHCYPINPPRACLKGHDDPYFRHRNVVVWGAEVLADETKNHIQVVINPPRVCLKGHDDPYFRLYFRHRNVVVGGGGVG